jgi:hypothetical protein
MSEQIQRVLFYDREYLRAFDFTAEQTYHLEMRRRLNIALHLKGIVSGLELMMVADTGNQVCINPGMAIDGYGREIVLLDRYILSDDDFRIAQITVGGPGDYAVCISYDREPATPPSAGYNACGANGQYTRWTEQPTIQILDRLPNLPDPPSPTDPLPDDPKRYPWPVFLGWVRLAVSAGGVVSVSQIVTVAGQREYIGLRTQRIIAPSAMPPAPTGGPAPDPAIYIDKDSPITVESNLQEELTLIVGNDFQVDKAQVKPNPPADPNFPGTAGNLKVEKNLFVLGNLYKALPDPAPAPGGPSMDWYALSDYIKLLLPDLKTGMLKIDVAGDPNPKPLTVPSDNLQSVRTANIYVAVGGIEWQKKADLLTWWGALADPGTIQFNVSGLFQNVTVGNPKACDFTVAWTVAPQSTDPLIKFNIKSLTVNYLVIFYA